MSDSHLNFCRSLLGHIRTLPRAQKKPDCARSEGFDDHPNPPLIAAKSRGI